MKLRLHMEREITEEQAKKLINTARIFVPDLVRVFDELGGFDETDISSFVGGLVAGHVDKLLGDKGSFRDRWTFTI